MSEHDPHCPPGLKAVGPENCPTCVLLNAARIEERERFAGIAERAYALGREDAAVAVREFAVNSIPFLPSDTPLSMAVRVKEILSIAAMGVNKSHEPGSAD
jgi:hypothetical protein